MVLYTLHLFAGGGGGILADLLLGHTPVGAVEIEEYQRRVLLSRQLDGSLPKFPIWDDVQTFRIDNPNTAGYIQNLQKIRSCLCICGGFPCQDISVAGKGAGIAGTRSGLWKDFARIIGEIRPRYAFLENSAAILVRGVDTVLGDLASMGYDAQWGVVSAADSGAPHQRRRWWCIASDTDGLRELQPQGSLPEFWRWPCDGCNAHSDTYRESIQKQPDTESNAPKLAESGMGGMAHGLAAWLDETAAGIWFDAEEHGLKRTCSKIQDRVKRLKTLGNGQVPQTAALAWNLLMDHLHRTGTRRIKMLLTAKEVAERLQVSECRVQLWAKNGELKAVNVSRRMTSAKPVLRFREQDVEDFLEGRTVGIRNRVSRSPRTHRSLIKDIDERARAVGLRID